MTSYKSICKDCKKESIITTIYGYAEFWAESHMMAAGHANVDIIEVYTWNLKQLTKFY